MARIREECERVLEATKRRLEDTARQKAIEDERKARDFSRERPCGRLDAAARASGAAGEGLNSRKLDRNSLERALK